MANFDHQNLTDDERTQLARAEPYIDQYVAEKDWMLRIGTTLRGYVETCRQECGDGTMPGALVSGLEKLQPSIGQPMNAANPLA